MRSTQQNTRSKNYKHFCRTERYELSILLKKGYSLRDIAEMLGRSPSSVSRELKRNKVNDEYESKKAQHKARVKRLYSKYQGMKIRETPELENYIHQKIKLGWSPEKIAGRLKLESDVLITHKTIYKYIHHNPFGWKLAKLLKYQGKEWKRKKSSKWGEIIKNRVFIGQRPGIINARMRYGDFEADTMGRTKDASSETLVVARERKSRFILARKVQRLRYAVDGLKKLFASIPVCSITFDNGPENARYQELGVSAYFCNPFHSWEKGSVENAIGIIREHIPKKSDLADFSDEFISATIDRINNIPMKCLGFRTPKEIFEGRYLKINKEQCCT